MDKSSANLGQLTFSVRDSWYVANPIFNLIIAFVQSNQSYDFNRVDDLKWHHLLRFTDAQLFRAITKSGISKKNKADFMKCMERARHWDSPIGTKIEMDPAQYGRLKEAFQKEDRKDNLPAIDEDCEHAIYLPLRDILLAAKLISDSGHPDAKRILTRMKENMPQMNRSVLIEQTFDIDWQEGEAGFHFVMHDSHEPTRMASKRWDTLYKGYNVTLIRQSMDTHFTAFINFDEEPIEIINTSESIEEANGRIDAFIRHEQDKIKKLSDNKPE